MEGKNSITFYTNWKEIFDKFDYNLKGQLIDLILAYVNDLCPEDEDIENYAEEHGIKPKIVGAFYGIQPIFKQDLKKWKNQRNINAANGKLGGRPKKQDKPNETEKTESVNKEAKKGVNVKVNVNVKDNVNVNELSKDNNNNSIVSKDTRSNTYDLNTAFEYFWGLYPKKVGKQKCLNWFKTHHPKRDLVTKMCEAVKNQSKSEQWTKDDGKYIPMCYTWLNRGGWDDILEKEMPKSEFDINGGFEEL